MVRNGIASAAAATTTPASQRGAPAPTSSVRVACHAIRPHAAAAHTTFRSLPARAAPASDKNPNNGARTVE